MPDTTEGPEEVLTMMEGSRSPKHGADGAAVITDPCLQNAEIVAPDRRQTDEGMVCTVPPAIAIPNTQHSEDDGDRFTPVTDKSPTPVQLEVSGEEPEDEIQISSRPSSASPARMRSAGKEKEKVQVETVPEKLTPTDLGDLLPPRRKVPEYTLTFKELTAEFDRILKPLTQQLTQQKAVVSGSDYYDTSGDCVHPVLAVEPGNPATPPKSFKIHKQRTVIRPGYSYQEPVLFDLHVNPDTLTSDGIASIMDMAHSMKPLPPRIDNFTHAPPSMHLSKPCFYVPRPKKHAVRRPIQVAGEAASTFPSTCKSSSLKLE